MRRHRSVSGSHSECQAPAARWCSWIWAPNRVATRPGACRAQASALTAATGLRLCGRVEDPDAGAALLGHLADLGLGEQDDVLGRGSHRARHPPQGARELGDTAAFGVPGQHRFGQAESVGQGGADAGTVLAQRGQGAHRTAELDRRSLVERAPQARARRVEPVRPTGRDHPEGRGQGLLQQGAAGHGGVPVFGRQRTQARSGTVQILQQRGPGTARQEHRRGVHDVLAGGALVDASGRLRVGLTHPGGQLLDQGDDGVAAARGRPPQRPGVVQARVAGTGDGLGARGREQTGVGQSPGQGGLGVEQRPQPGGVVGQRADGAPREDPVEQAGHVWWLPRWTKLGRAGREHRPTRTLRCRRRPSLPHPANGCRNGNRRGPRPPRAWPAPRCPRPCRAPDRRRWRSPPRGSTTA